MKTKQDYYKGIQYNFWLDLEKRELISCIWHNKGDHYAMCSRARVRIVVSETINGYLELNIELARFSYTNILMATKLINDKFVVGVTVLEIKDKFCLFYKNLPLNTEQIKKYKKKITY